MKHSQPSVKLMWRTKLPNGWRYLPCIMETPIDIPQPKPEYAILDGKPAHLPQGSYYIRKYRDGKKLHTRCKSQHPRDVAHELRNVMATARKEAAGRSASSQTPHNRFKSPTAPLKRAASAYEHDLSRQNYTEAAGQAKLVLSEFLPTCWSASTVQEITREHILNYHQRLRLKGLAERTIANKHMRLHAFLRWTGTSVTFMPKPPRYETKLPVIYSPAELSAIRIAAAGEPYMAALVDMALMLGLRMRELMFAAWDDLDTHHGTFTVRGKPNLGFRIKDSEQREIPVPEGLLTRLKAWHEERPQTTLILGTAADKPNNHLLRALKRLATRAGLNPEAFTLHQFRRNYLTTMLRGDFDVATVQSYAGHSDLATTLRYLKPASASETQVKVTAVWG